MAQIKDDNNSDMISHDDEKNDGDDESSNNEIDESGLTETGEAIPTTVKEKKKFPAILIKAILVLAILTGVIYLIYFSTRYGMARFTLSGSEIIYSAETPSISETKFTIGKRIYFFVDRENKNLEAEMLKLEIHYFEKNSYKQYKQINYEIGRSFPKLGAFIPGEYFTRDGKYMIKVLLDSTIVADQKFDVVR